MRRICTLLGLAALALHLSATEAHADRPGTVTSVSVEPATGRTAIVVAVDSSVAIQDFTLSSPSRIVLDLTGATLAMAPQLYDKVRRGGVTNVRIAQYRPNIVRVVVELDAPHQYTLTRGARDVRLALDGTGAAFTPWHASVGRAATVATAAAPAARDARRMRAIAPATPVPAPLTPAPSQRRMTFKVQDADIRDVIASFAAFSGRTIVVGRQVQGTVTADIHDQPWDVALQAVLQAQGLAASTDASGIITVDSYQNILAKQASEPLTTQLISVNYANANALVPTIKSLLSKDCSGAGATTPPSPGAAAPGCLVRGTVSADSATNTLLVTEVPSRMGDVLSYVRDLDIRTPQVAIKAKIIFVSRTNIEQLGISYDLGTANQFSNRLVQRVNPTTGQPMDKNTGVIDVGGDALSGVVNANRNFQTSSALDLIYSTMIGKFSLTAFIDALQEVRLADTQAEPNIVTLDNRKAEILVGEETPIRVIDANSQGGSSGVKSNVQFKESGIILSVTPHITNNRQILMTLHAEQSQLQAAAADLGFTFLKRRADTQLLVNDGETAAIGGLTITQVTTSKSGIPLLVELPLIGRLFGETKTDETKQDLLILMTPHIVDEGEAIRPNR